MGMNKLKSKFLGSCIGTAVGDQFGADGTRYTDDTAMMIGIAESLIENKGFNRENMARTFIKNYEAEPWRGYGFGPPMIFKMIQSGWSIDQAAQQLYPGGSFGNGSAMRIAPVGLFYYDNPSQLREIAYESSRITHSHSLGMEGAALQAYAVALSVSTEPEQCDKYDFLKKLNNFIKADLYKEKLKNMEILLKEYAGKPRVIKELGNTIEAFNSIPISIYSFLANVDFESTLKYALSLGGDRDTISAMTGAIAGACYGIENIPEKRKSKLENREYIEKLAEKLWQVKTQKRAEK
jgi:poly(ADP-ribose) glycohydrolase ARH3